MGTFATGIENDYQYLDEIEEVSFTPKGKAAVTGVKALRRALSVSEITLYGGTLGDVRSAVVFNLWTSTLDDEVPDAHDLITDASSNKFRILSSQQLTVATRWRVVCVPV